jgi:hypothetical protein
VKTLIVTLFVTLIVTGAAHASWVLIPGDTNDTRLHGCGASWEICKQRKAAKTPTIQRQQRKLSK